MHLTVAEIEADNFTHIEARCACERVTLLPFRLLRAEGYATDATPIDQIAGRLRCSRCGRSPQSWRAWRADLDVQPPAAAATWGMMPPDGRRT